MITRNSISRKTQKCGNCPQLIHIGYRYFFGKELKNSPICSKCMEEQENE